MSANAMRWAMSLPLPAHLSHTLVCLTSCANERRAGGVSAFPSIAALAELRKASRRAVVYQLRELEDLGVIERAENKVGQTGQITVWRWALEPVPNLERRLANIKRLKNNGGNGGQNSGSGAPERLQPTAALEPPERLQPIAPTRLQPTAALENGKGATGGSKGCNPASVRVQPIAPVTGRTGRTGSTAGGKRPANIDECIAYFAEWSYPEHVARAFFHKNEAMGWKTKAGPIQKWRSAAQSWMANEDGFIKRRQDKPRTALDEIEDGLNAIGGRK